MSSNRLSNQTQVPSNKKYSVTAKDAHKLQLLQKRRQSDAKCRANLSFSFEQLKAQVLDEATINTRVSREMILHETLSKIQYLEGILVLLEQTKDKQEGKKYVKSAVSRLETIHREFSKSYSSSSHGNKKPKEKFMSSACENKSSKMILPSQQSDMKIIPKVTKAVNSNRPVWLGDVTDQVVPKPSPEATVKDSPPHTIIVPYIGHKSNEYGPQEVPVCFSPGIRPMTPQSLARVPEHVYQQEMSSSPRGTPSRRYKIKGSSIKCVPMDDMAWDKVDFETSEDDSVDSSSPEPDLTCKEVFPYWLEEDRTERTTPLKPPNTSQMTYPYPMAPRKNKNTSWSAKYMEHLYENDETSEEHGKRQQRQGKRLFSPIETDALRSPSQKGLDVSENDYVKPKRHYRKLCTAARVRPYNHITGKVESPCKRFRNCRSTKRKASKVGKDPEFRLNSYFKRKMKKNDVSTTNAAAFSARRKRSGSPEIGYQGVDIMDDWMRKAAQRENLSNNDNVARPDDDINSQSSLVLTDVPHLPEDIISPLDIDDEGIVDTILDLEESSMPPIEPSLPDISSSHVQMKSSQPKETLEGGFFGTEQDRDMWHDPNPHYTSETSDEPRGDDISPSLAAYACMALSNSVKSKFPICTTSPSALTQDGRTAPIMSPVVYFSPVKQNPLIRSNPTLSSTLLTDNDQLANTTRERYSDFSFASPLSTSSLFSDISPLVIDVNDIKEVEEVQLPKDGLPSGDVSKGVEVDLWDIDKMMDINSSLGELIDREVFLCSPKMMPRNFVVNSQDVEVPCGDSTKMTTPDTMDQLLPSSWKSKDSGTKHLSSQDSMFEYQVVPNFLHSEDEGEILDLSLPSENLN